MHVIKSGWVGQTFALAKCNESESRKTRIRRSKEERKAMAEDRKTRIRRSKEERKAMAEDFIKKYQKSNNGSFPSLNLTHKEVGGSFYTVREIVRDVIQENRVLGPGKLSFESLNDQLSELIQEPFGSIAIEHQNPFTTSNDIQLLPNDHHEENKMANLVSEDCAESKVQEFNDGLIVNGSPVDVKENKSDEQIDTELQVNQHIEEEKNVEEELEVSPGKKVTPIVAADLVVETFPLRPISKTIDNSDGEMKNFDLVEEVGRSETEENFSVKTSVLVDEKEMANPATPLGTTSGLVNEEALKGIRDPLVENSNGSVTIENNEPELQETQDLEGKVTCTETITSQKSEPGPESPESKGNSPNVTQSKNLKEEIGIENKFDSMRGSSPNGSSPTLDRINLESWDRTSKNAKPRSNPLLATFKAFVAAFVKFWSE